MVLHKQRTTPIIHRFNFGADCVEVEFWSSNQLGRKPFLFPTSCREISFENSEQRQRKTKSGITSTFSGLVYCADCGEKLYYGATNNGKREGAFFDCSVHWKHKDKCGTHFIRESVLERMVLKHIQLVMGYILRYRQHFISVMEQ